MLTVGAVMVRAQSEAEGRRVPDVLERRGPPQHRLALDLLDDRLATVEPLGERLGDPAAHQGDDAHPGLCELDGELAAQRLDRVEGDLRPAEVVVAQRPGSTLPPKARITPDPCPIMWRAAALAVRNVVRAAVFTGAMKSSTPISAKGIPWSPRPTRRTGTTQSDRMTQAQPLGLSLAQEL
jgi:hypothetical protein